MIVVHHLETSRSHRILWLLEELGLPYEIKTYKRNAKTMLAPPELAKIHPLGKSPVIVDDGLVLAESGAIIEYLIDRYAGGRLRPAAGTPEHLRYVYWMHYAEGSAMPPLLLKLVFQRMPRNAPFLLRPLVRSIAEKAQRTFVDPQFHRHAAYWNAELSGAPWFAGDAFSAADIQMSYPVENGMARFAAEKKYPAVAAFIERIRARPAYKKAVERGGPPTLARR
jgi:glutathione S-transferase